MTGNFVIRDSWCRKIPLLHQILAGSSSPKKFPDPTQVLELEEACAVWEALHYLLRSLLGWQNPAQGLAWWYRNGRPISESELLRLTVQLWGWNNAIDFYAAWAWTSTDLTAGDLGERADFPDETWWTEFRKRPKAAWVDPYHGGANPLHLGHSEFGLLEGHEGELDPTQAWELFQDQKKRRAVLIVNGIGVWRDAIQRADGRLANLGNRSWYVDVFDRQFGFLGTFRKSRVTNRWFQGKHSIHMAGNPGN